MNLAPADVAQMGHVEGQAAAFCPCLTERWENRLQLGPDVL